MSQPGVTIHGSVPITVAPHVAMPLGGGMTVGNPDSIFLASAEISISGNYHPGEDVLGFDGRSSGLTGNITVTSNSNGTLTLTSPGATAFVLQWEEALSNAVTYTNTSDTPSTDIRTISFTVNNGTATSEPATREVSVLPPEGHAATALLYAALTPSTFGTIDPNTGAQTFISDLPAGLNWTLGDAVNQSDPIHGVIFSKQSPLPILAISKTDGATNWFSPPNFSALIGYDCIANKLIYADLLFNNLYSYDMITNSSTLISAGFSSQRFWLGGGIAAVNSYAREAYIYDQGNHQIDVIDLDTGVSQSPLLVPSNLVEITLDEVNQKIIGLIATEGGLRLGSIDVNSGELSLIGGVVGRDRKSVV